MKFLVLVTVSNSATTRNIPKFQLSKLYLKIATKIQISFNPIINEVPNSISYLFRDSPTVRSTEKDTTYVSLSSHSSLKSYKFFHIWHHHHHPLNIHFLPRMIMSMDSCFPTAQGRWPTFSGSCLSMGILEPCSLWRKNFFDCMPLLLPPTLWDEVFLTYTTNLGLGIEYLSNAT